MDNQRLDMYKTFFEGLKEVLPCAACRRHYGQYLMDTPLANIKNKDEFLIWLHNLHNQVRKRNKTKPRNITSVLKFYENRYGTSYLYSYCTIFVAVAAFMVIFFYHARKYT
jgi:hypothetical protein